MGWWSPIARKVQYQEYSKAKTLGRPRNCVAADRGGNATASKSNRQDDGAVIPQIRFSVHLAAVVATHLPRTTDHRTQVSIPRPSEPTKHSNIRNIQVEHARQYSQVNGIPARVSRPTLRHIRTRLVVSPGQRDTHPRESEATLPSEHARQYSQVNGIPARVSSNRRVPVAGGEGV